MKVARIRKKTKNVIRVFYWFVIYNLLHGQSGRVLHLFKALFKHYFFKTPYAVIIETGNTCNFNCPTCPTPHEQIYQRRKPEMMSWDTFKKIIDNIKDYVHIVYLYNSNEPLLHPMIVDMIRYCSENNLHTMISTNCSLLDERRARELLDSGLGEIRFALDGLTKESFEGFRVGGDFALVKANIERFCRLKKEMKKTVPITTMQFILNKLNQDQVQDIKEFVKINEIDRLYIKPFILSGYAYSVDAAKELSDRFFIDQDVSDDNIVYKKDEVGLKPVYEPTKCPDVEKIFTILADGRAVMCCFDLFGDYIYAQADKEMFKDWWFGEKSRNLRLAAKNRKLPLCKVCGNIE